MEVLSHRGFWINEAERNTIPAFIRSFDQGFGTETDLRDHNGEIVISHDMPEGEQLLFSELLEIMNGRNLTLALNIKADGLSQKVKEILRKYEHTNYFVFDMSIPDLVRQVKDGLKVFTGLSDIQPEPVLLEQSEGIWLDCFKSDWYDSRKVDDLLSMNKKVCVVSADLHHRETDVQWARLRAAKAVRSANLLLCTDTPLKAQEYFQEYV